MGQHRAVTLTAAGFALAAIPTSPSCAQGRACSRDLSVPATTRGIPWNAGGFMKTPLGEALQDAIRKSVDKIAAAMRKIPRTASVIECSGTDVYITAGADQGIEPGMVLHVYHKIRELTEPPTGAVLDMMMDPVGTILAATVRDKISIATITEGNPPARGEVVKLN